MANVILDNVTINQPVANLAALASIPTGALVTGCEVFVISPGITYVWNGSAWTFSGIYPPVADNTALNAIVTTGFVANKVLVLETDIKIQFQWNGSAWIAVNGNAATRTASNVSLDNLSSVSGSTTSGEFAQFNDPFGTITSSGVTSASFLQSANNLSDVASVATSRTNLGLGDAALKGVTNNSLGDLASVDGPVTSGDFAQFNDSGGTITSSGVSSASFLQAANNLSDVASAGTSRTNLGLGDAAVKAVSDNTYTVVPTILGPVVVGNVATFADTVGTIQDGGSVAPIPSFTGVAYNTGGTLSAATANEITDDALINPGSEINNAITSTDIVLNSSSPQTSVVGRTVASQSVLMPDTTATSAYAAGRPYVLLVTQTDGTASVFYPLALKDYLGNPILDPAGNPVVMNPGDTWIVFYQSSVSVNRAYQISSLPLPISVGTLAVKYATGPGTGFTDIPFTLYYSISNGIITMNFPEINMGATNLTANTYINVLQSGGSPIPASLTPAEDSWTSIAMSTNTLAGSFFLGLFYISAASSIFEFSPNLALAQFTSGQQLYIPAFTVTAKL